jgi:hypothetical protein
VLLINWCLFHAVIAKIIITMEPKIFEANIQAIIRDIFQSLNRDNFGEKNIASNCLDR